MNRWSLSFTPNPSIGGAHDSDAEFELLDDDITDLGLSKLQINNIRGTNHHDARKKKSAHTADVIDTYTTDIKGIRALRQDIVSKHSSNEISRHFTSSPQVKIFYTSKARPGVAILQSGDSVAEQDFSPNSARVLPESLIFWNKRSIKGSSGFFIETRPSNNEEHGLVTDLNGHRPAYLESASQRFELFTPSKDFGSLIYWGTMEYLPDALPDLEEQEFRGLPRQVTRSDLYRESIHGSSGLDLADLNTDDFDSLLSESVHKVECIGFRRIGVNPDLTGKFGWSRQKLSPGAREYLLARKDNPDWVPILDIPKTARRIRRLPRSMKSQPSGGLYFTSRETPLEHQPTTPASSSRRTIIQDVTTDLDALDIGPLVFRASKRRRDEESTIIPEFAIESEVRPSKKKTKQFEVDIGLEEWEDVEEATVKQKSKKKERKMKKSRARRKRDKEVKEVAGMLDRLSMGHLDHGDDEGMEGLTPSESNAQYELS
ncbi:hypothetical protein FRC01_002439 [Tulasnella sp. 417]|nr:hypothetical protein FRC01_002439 [Tulasnella sp. 417]